MFAYSFLIRLILVKRVILMIIMTAYSICALINLSFVIAIVLLFDSSCYFYQVKNYLRIYQRISHRNF